VKAAPGLQAVEYEDDDEEDDYGADYVGAESDVDWVKPPLKRHWCYKDTVKAWGQRACNGHMVCRCGADS
jgi:hypothetical protein